MIVMRVGPPVHSPRSHTPQRSHCRRTHLQHTAQHGLRESKTLETPALALLLIGSVCAAPAANALGPVEAIRIIATRAVLLARSFSARDATAQGDIWAGI